MSYTAYVALILSSGLLLLIGWRFLKYQDARYEEEIRQKEEKDEKKE